MMSIDKWVEKATNELSRRMARASNKLVIVYYIESWMEGHPGEPMPLGAGWINPEAALDLLREGPLEVIDCMKRS